MKKMMCLTHLGVLLLALHLLSSQVVQAQVSAMNKTMNETMTAMTTTMAPINNTGMTDKNGCGRMDSFTLLLPLALAASLLHSWSQ